MKQSARGGNLRNIQEEFKRRLTVMRYSESSVRHYLQILGWIKEFQEGYGEKNYSREIGQRFIADYRLHDYYAPSMFRLAKTVVRRIDEILEGKQFAPCFRESQLIQCPPRFTEWYDNYIESLIKRGLSKSTITTRKRYSGQLLGRLPPTVASIKELTAADLYDTFTKYEWPTVSLSTARCFLKFLFETCITKADMSVCVPNPRRPRPLPSVYSCNEISKLLLAVDRATSVGKRDYAIIMLAAHLGLRSSDIVNLSFSDVDRAAKTISTIQIKTGRPITLVMNKDVEEAIDDYIQNGRPESSNEKVFLLAKAPYTPISAAAGYAVVRQYFDIAGIPAQGRRRGPHALRASFATALVGKDVPYAVIQEALGHEDPESAKHYVRVDVKRLRMCALNVPKPTGAFAVMLSDLEGVL